MNRLLSRHAQVMQGNVSLTAQTTELYVGGYPALTHRNVLRLMSGYSVRYKLTDLAERNDLELPVPAESGDEAKPQNSQD